jgi:hypothetical protein
MPSRFSRAIAGATLLLTCGFGSTADAQTTAARWHGDLKQGAEASRTSGKPLFVVFRCVR